MNFTNSWIFFSSPLTLMGSFCFHKKYCFFCKVGLLVFHFHQVVLLDHGSVTILGSHNKWEQSRQWLNSQNWTVSLWLLPCFLVSFYFYCEGGRSGRELVLVYQTCFFLSERNLRANAVQSCLCSVSQNLVGEVGQDGYWYCSVWTHKWHACWCYPFFRAQRYVGFSSVVILVGLNERSPKAGRLFKLKK